VNSILKVIELPARPGEDKSAPPGVTTVPLTLSVARVGNVAMVGLGAEVFHEIGRAIKDASPFPYTLIITHCNNGIGYCRSRKPTPKAVTR